jgi:HEPN domain-containing protein
VPSQPQIATAETLAKKAIGDALVVERLAPHDDIGDGPIGFWAQQAVEKAIKVGLALRGVDFPMMEHDLAFLSRLCTECGLFLPDDMTDIDWLTPCATTYENAEDPPGALDRDSAVAVSRSAVDWCQALVEEVRPASPEQPPPRPSPVPGLGRPETRGLR